MSKCPNCQTPIDLLRTKKIGREAYYCGGDEAAQRSVACSLIRELRDKVERLEKEMSWWKRMSAQLQDSHDDLARALFEIRRITMRKHDYIEVANIACEAVRSLDETILFTNKSAEGEG